MRADFYHRFAMMKHTRTASGGRRLHPRALATGLVLAAAWVACVPLLLAQAGAGPSTTPPSAGLLNDWLRERSQRFDAWDFGGQVRVRFESKDGFAVPGAGASAVDFSDATPDNNYWLFREKVHLGWKPCGWFSAFAEARDSSTVFDKRTPEPEEDVLDLHQAWVALGDPKQFPLTLKVGRQELSYGDERLVGAFDWNNIGRVFDAAKARYERDALWVDAFAGRVVLANDGRFNVANDYDWFWGVYASSRAAVPRQETQLYVLARNTSPESPVATTGRPQAGGPGARDIYTIGLRVKSLPGQFGGWDYEAELAGQFGDFYDATLGRRLEHEAFAAHVAGGYTWRQFQTAPRLGLEYNYASGDNDPTDGRHRTFENLFPTNHKFYGYMDFVSWQNLHNVRLSAALKPAKGVTVTADYHLFWLAETADYFYAVSGLPRRTGGYSLAPGNDGFVGSELDLVATCAIRSFGALQAGYGHFFRGDYVRQSLAATGSRDADWFYLQLVLNF
jgi:hypothetical protein